MLGDTGGGGGGPSDTRRTIIFSVLIAIAIILLLAGSIVSENWLSMVMLLPILAVPVLLFIMESKGGDSGGAMGAPSPAAQAWKNFGQCSFGALLTCFIGLPVVLLVTNKIGATNFGFWIGATAVSLVGAAYYFATKSTD